MIDFTEVLAANSNRFREVLAGVPAATRVPSCPDWAADDLLWHLTEVQSFWLTIVDQGLQTDEDVLAVTAPGRPVTPDAAIALFEKVSFQLAMKLGVIGDDVPAWTWTPNHTVGWVRRRQAQEALMHRVDAELTAGLPSEIDPGLAEDGVDEVLTQFGSEPPAWVHSIPPGCWSRSAACRPVVPGTCAWGASAGSTRPDRATTSPTTSPPTPGAPRMGSLRARQPTCCSGSGVAGTARGSAQPAMQPRGRRFARRSSPTPSERPDSHPPQPSRTEEPRAPSALSATARGCAA